MEEVILSVKMAGGTGIILAVILLCVFYFVLNVYDSYKLRKLRDKWTKEEQNDNRENNPEAPGRVRAITTAEPSTAGATVAYQRSILSSTEAIPTGEADSSIRKHTKLARKFRRRFNRE